MKTIFWNVSQRQVQRFSLVHKIQEVDSKKVNAYYVTSFSLKCWQFITAITRNQTSLETKF